MTPADMLEAGAAWLETHDWTQGALAHGALGIEVSPRSPRAACWCGEGAVLATVTKDHIADAAFGAFVEAHGVELADFNDAAKAKAEVIAAMRDAARAWREQNGGA